MKSRNLFLSCAIWVLFLLLPFDVFSQGPPPWAPAHGYRAKTRYIFFPDHNFYFDRQEGTYIYIRSGDWTVEAKLPSLFRDLNLASAVQVELDLTAANPHRYNGEHLLEYKVKHPKQSKASKVKGKARGKGRH